MKIENTQVYGFEPAIRGMRMPLNSHHLSDSKYDDKGNYIVGEKDLDLMKRLVLAGTEHAKFMRYITVYMDISAPLYWWKEFDTYKVGTTANSTSTMHKITSRLLDENDFEWDKDANTKVSVTGYRKDMLEHINNLITYYNNFATQDEKQDIFRIIIQDLPSSFIQTRTITLNYAVLRNMYFQRRYHKLTEWRDVFCGWIATLPYAKELIMLEDKS
jgi:hypothetical protein